MWCDMLRNFESELILSGKYREITDRLSSANGTRDLMHYAESLLKKYSNIFKWEPSLDEPNKKDDRKSLAFREQGNILHKVGKYLEALHCYNKSICFAASADHLAFGYSNRSAVLFEMGRFHDCLENIRLARVSSDLPMHLKTRLDKREKQCRERQTASDINKFKRELSYKTHEKVPFIVDRLEIRREGLNVWLYAKEYLEPGKFVAKVKAIIPPTRSVHKTRCYFCLKTCANLIPCPNCTSVMFCDENCLSRATDEFHKWECSVMDLLNIFDFVEVFSLQIVLKLLHTLGDIKALAKYWEELPRRRQKWFTVDKSKYNAVDHFIAFHSFVFNSRSDFGVKVLPNLLNIVILVAFLKREILKHSNLKNIFRTEQQKNLFGELLYHNIITCAVMPINKVTELNSFDFGTKYIEAFSVISEIKFSGQPNVEIDWIGQHLMYRTCRPIMKGEPLLVMPERQENDHEYITMESLEELRQSFLLDMLTKNLRIRQNFPL